MIKEALVELSKKQGFAFCRVAPSVPPPHAEAFHQWLAEGCAGSMEWLARNKEKRTNPNAILPEAKSLIVLAMNYWQENLPKPADDAARGRISRYAWGADYHDLILERMKPLVELLASHGGIQKPYCDTGPVLEKDMAARAGIGWQGKSSIILNRTYGTWFFLSEIITTIALPHDEPEEDRCGSCTRCITACPTQAIVAPHKVDARRCISYLTIENKGSIPIEFRKAIGNRIYGCDTCLDVCPWNKFAKASRETTFAVRDAVSEMALRDYLGMDEETFRMLFQRSAIKRIKRSGFLRNVCVALGNVGTPEDLPALEKAAKESDPLIVEHAVWAIEQIQERFSSGK